MKNIFIICFLGFFNYATSQVLFSYGPELGISISTLPKYEEWESVGTTRSIEIDPIYSPVVGLSAVLERMHLQFRFGIKYEQIGQITRNFRSVIPIPIDESRFTSDQKIKQIFHTINLPLSIGYGFDVKRFKYTLFLGLKPQYFFGAKHNESDQLVYSDNAKNNSTSEMTYLQLVKGLRSQVIVGMSLLINKKIDMVLNYGYGRNIIYWIKQPIGFCGTGHGNILKNQNLALSVTYFLNN